MTKRELWSIALDGAIIATGLVASIRDFDRGNNLGGVLFMIATVIWTISLIKRIERSCDEEL